MEANKSISLTPAQVSVLIDAVHERFMAVSSGRERPDTERSKLLDTLSNLHARLQEMEDEGTEKHEALHRFYGN